MSQNDAFPIDFDGIKKGDTIPQEKIESIYQCKFSERPQEYGFKVLALCEEIRNHRDDLRAHVRGQDYGIVILTDEEAEVRTQSDIEKSQRRIIRTTKNRASIDRSEFGEHNMRVAEYNDRQNTSCAMMIRKNMLERKREVAMLQLLAPKQAAE